MKKSLSVAILNLQKELNVGGIIRTANAACVEEVLIIGRKRWNKYAATGGHSKTPIVHMKTIPDFLDYCQKRDYSLVSLEIGKVSKNIFEYEYPKKTMLIVGNEGTGVPEKILSASKDIVRIPQYGDVECLNASVSASIGIYDWVRKEKGDIEKRIIGSKFI